MGTQKEKMMKIEDLRKEFGEDVYAYRQEYAGAPTEKDGYSDEYVQFLEQKLQNTRTPVPKEAELSRCDCGTCIECTTIFNIYDNNLEDVVLKELLGKSVSKEAEFEDTGIVLSLNEENYISLRFNGDLINTYLFEGEELPYIKEGQTITLYRRINREVE